MNYCSSQDELMPDEMQKFHSGINDGKYNTNHRGKSPDKVPLKHQF